MVDRILFSSHSITTLTHPSASVLYDNPTSAHSARACSYPLATRLQETTTSHWIVTITYALARGVGARMLRCLASAAAATVSLQHTGAGPRLELWGCQLLVLLLPLSSACPNPLPSIGRKTLAVFVHLEYKIFMIDEIPNSRLSRAGSTLSVVPPAPKQTVWTSSGSLLESIILRYYVRSKVSST